MCNIKLSNECLNKPYCILHIRFFTHSYIPHCVKTCEYTPDNIFCLLPVLPSEDTSLRSRN